MKSMLPAAFAAFLCMLLLAACRGPVEPQPQAFEADPIVAYGHGVFIGRGGKPIDLDAGFITKAQNYYIDRLTRQAADEDGRIDRENIARMQKRIQGASQDTILANALLIDWLLEKLGPVDSANLTSINNGLRWRYYLDILKKKRPKGPRWTKGIDPDQAEDLEEEGVPATVLLKTTEGGREYVRQCREAGVPVPEAMFSGEWQFMGTFEKEFISTSSEADLWLHTSTSPQGVCLALPRYPGAPAGGANDAGLLGIICLGTQTNKSCFFDNPNGRAFARNVEVSIHEFVGGVDLVANAQGTCTDCHAGENPYVVHPEKPPFAALPNLQPGGWPDPLVDASWPQNPGPTNLLDAVASPGRCDSCHQVGSAGRFPELSSQLSGYCGTVLANAVNEEILTGYPPDPDKRTMPPFGMDKGLYTAHIDAMKAACNGPPGDVGVVVDVDIPDDEGFISPPIVIDPLYQCATQVAVRSAILDATLELFVNGASVGTTVARNPTREEFDVPDLVAGDTVTARQTFNGVDSALSAAVTVRDHTLDFPGGLPAPEIDPDLIHECGEIIAVRHVPGAKLTVLSNGGDPRSRSTSTDWSAMVPGKRPFDVGDTFTARAALCADESPLSAPVNAVAAPADIAAPTLDPSTVYAGQELVTIENIVYGARVSLAEASFGALGEFAWPVSWFPDFDVATPLGAPLAAGNQLITAQRLCESSPRGQTPPAEPCEALPAPKIGHPIVGDDFVVVTESVPGARIRVYDATNDELGDGSGTVVMLKRAITGVDTLTVVQQLGDCTSGQGYRVSVRNPKGDSG